MLSARTTRNATPSAAFRQAAADGQQRRGTGRAAGERRLMNRRCIGLLAERYSKWERRAALTPSHVQRLVSQNIDVLVQPSTSRVYSDAEYSQAGASLTTDLSDAVAILGVKQPVNGTLLPEKTYLFFSHVIKAQV